MAAPMSASASAALHCRQPVDLVLDHLHGDFASMFQAVDDGADIVFLRVVRNWFSFHNFKLM